MNTNILNPYSAQIESKKFELHKIHICVLQSFTYKKF